MTNEFLLLNSAAVTGMAVFFLLERLVTGWRSGFRVLDSLFPVLVLYSFSSLMWAPFLLKQDLNCLSGFEEFLSYKTTILNSVLFAIAMVLPALKWTFRQKWSMAWRDAATFGGSQVVAGTMIMASLKKVSYGFITVGLVLGSTCTALTIFLILYLLFRSGSAERDRKIQSGIIVGAWIIGLTVWLSSFLAFPLLFTLSGVSIAIGFITIVLLPGLLGSIIWIMFFSISKDELYEEDQVVIVTTFIIANAPIGLMYFALLTQPWI